MAARRAGEPDTAVALMTADTLLTAPRRNSIAASCPVSVIIPTLASAERADLLARAMKSVLTGQDHGIVLIVVANGSRFDPETLAGLKARRDIRFIYREEGSAAAARLAGRQAVDTEFFATLDDDDEFLPRAFERQMRYMRADPTIDVVITNGYRRHGEVEVVDFPDFANYGQDPLWHLMETCWLQPAGGLYRTETVTPDIFATPFSMEWTYLAMVLALHRRLWFVDVPTYRMHRETPGSLSSALHWQRQAPETLRRMLAFDAPPSIRRRLKQKHADALHTLAEWASRDGDQKAAWQYHLRSLLSPYGLRYLPFTRRLVQRAHTPL
ncbi:MAG TPA: glycosyltransferase family A protein [Candidatus Sulfotelmatobacter sp.]|nr:glycosyltransferase family A protein [Candidatus Sulfotelmatobacter sp.]